MKILHIVPGTSDISNGMVVVANLIAKEQGESEVVDLNQGQIRICQKDINEIWVHGMWLPREWLVCRGVLKAGKRLVRMTHGSLSPVYLENQSKWKKRVVSPIEKWLLRLSDKVIVTCESEAEWVRAYQPKVKRVEMMDLKCFFNLPKDSVKRYPARNFLYLGREHPLKGIEYLKLATADLNRINLRVLSHAFGNELEEAWRWADVLVLPTLSENFGLVIAEALERGKRVITTDGAPAWGDGKTYGGRLIYLNGYRDGSPDERVRLLKKAIGELTCQF